MAYERFIFQQHVRDQRLSQRFGCYCTVIVTVHVAVLAPEVPVTVAT